MKNLPATLNNAQTAMFFFEMILDSWINSHLWTPRVGEITGDPETGIMNIEIIRERIVPWEWFILTFTLGKNNEDQP